MFLLLRTFLVFVMNFCPTYLLVALLSVSKYRTYSFVANCWLLFMSVTLKPPVEKTSVAAILPQEKEMLKTN